MNFKNNIFGKKVTKWYVSDNDVTIFFACGSDLRVRHGSHNWRLVHNGEIIMSSSDLFALMADAETAVYWPMPQYDEPDTIDYEDYMAELFEMLDAHKDEKVKKCNELLGGETVVSLEVNELHDMTVVFSCGAKLEAFRAVPYVDGDQINNNILNIATKNLSDERTYII